MEAVTASGLYQMIPSRAIQSLRSASVPALVADYMDLRRSGPRWTAPCPFHNERTASFTVYDDHWHCFGCGLSGSGIDFLMRIEGMRFPEAAKALADRIGVTLDDKVVTAEQSRRAAEDAEFCRWWWDRRVTVLRDAIHSLVVDDEDAAESVGRILRHVTGLSVIQRFEWFKRDFTARDRVEWERARGAVERWWLEFGGWWVGTIAGKGREYEPDKLLRR